MLRLVARESRELQASYGVRYTAVRGRQLCD
jgi:hypothetical protein